MKNKTITSPPEQTPTIQQLLNDSRYIEFTWLLAGEPSPKIIDDIFKRHPWCVYLIIGLTKTVICRDEWEGTRAKKQELAKSLAELKNQCKEIEDLQKQYV